MTVLEMLPEMVRPKKLLGAVALAKLVHASQVFEPSFPILVWVVWEFFAAVAARVVRGWWGSVVVVG